jgi:hypothetical protein
MPALTTAIDDFDDFDDFNNCAASKSGHRRLLSAVEPIPSVIESPTITTTPLLPSPPDTSTSVRKYRLSSVSVTAKLVAAVKSAPRTMYAVCMPAPWMVDVAVPAGRYMLTASSRNAGMFMSTGSLNMLSPLAMAATGEPPKVNTWPVPGSMAAPPARKATCTGPISTGPAPYRLESRRRTRVPPALVRTIWRMVCAFSAGPSESGAAIQLVTQSGGVADQAAPASDNMKTTANRRRMGCGIPSFTDLSVPWLIVATVYGSHIPRSTRIPAYPVCALFILR